MTITYKDIYVYELDDHASGATVERLVDNIYHIRLTAEGRTVTANVYSHTGAWQHADMEIVFEVGGELHTVQTVDGMASITVPGEDVVTVRTLVKTMRNDEIVIGGGSGG